MHNGLYSIFFVFFVSVFLLTFVNQFCAIIARLFLANFGKKTIMGSFCVFSAYLWGCL